MSVGVSECECESMCVCVSVWVTECVSVWVWESVCKCVSVCVWVCECVCVDKQMLSSHKKRLCCLQQRGWPWPHYTKWNRPRKTTAPSITSMWNLREQTGRGCQGQGRGKGVILSKGTEYLHRMKKLWRSSVPVSIVSNVILHTWNLLWS